MKLQQVHLRINDAATGQPTPVRLRITDADGTYYAPYGRLTEFATGVNQDVGGNVQIGAKKWAYIDGACEILLPPGTLHIEVTKGPEFKPIDEHIELLAGKMSLRLTIERWSDTRKDGWYSGDTRAHFMSPDAALLEGQAEGLAVVNLLAKVHEGAIPNILSFSGQSFARQRGDCGVAVNTQNFHPYFGSLGLLHCHRVVYPLTFDDEDWTLLDWCGQCHRKKGLVVWTTPERQTPAFRHGEPLADLILGEIDAFEMSGVTESRFHDCSDYYMLLDADLTLPLVGASGKDSNATMLGALRTYAHLEAEQEFSYSRWIDAVRMGRTFVTNGPLLDFTIDGLVPGKTLKVPAGEQTLRLLAAARSATPFVRLELLWNGDIIAAATATTASPYEAVIERDFMPTDSAWLAIRCRGEVSPPDHPEPPFAFAHSSAVAIQKVGAPRAGDVAFPLTAKLEKLERHAGARNHGRLLRVLQEARTILAKKLS